MTPQRRPGATNNEEVPCMEVWPGQRYPLGATFDGTGTNFALLAEVATKVELCLFDAADTEQRVELHEVDAYVWHAYIPGVEPGQRYGYLQPGHGHLQ